MSNTYINQSDEALMELVKEGNAPAFDELYRRYSKKMVNYFFRMLGKDAEKAQDFLQDLFMKVVEKPYLFKEGHRFSTWLFTIASNMCKNEYRRLKVRVNGDPYIGDFNVTANDVVLPKIDQQLDYKQFKKLLYEEVAKMDKGKRETFILRYQEHLSIKEISKILDCSEGTIKSRLFYTTKKLAEKLKIYKPSKKENEVLRE